jgi:alanyl-tRNA synthetase
MLTSSEIRQRFLQFFKERGHVIIPSASLVPENDPSVLFNTAGMQPLVPYLLGKEHPAGKRIADIQKCVRTNDIDEVGDNTHLTFFEMMGNWSLGDYWKREAIEWSFELLTNPEIGFGLNPERLYVTCFEGDENAPRDEESAEIWRETFAKHNVTGERIYFRPAEKNWWSAGDNGPCGPDTEMFHDMTGELTTGMTLDEYLKADDEQRVVEIWNDVFMEYLKKDGKVVGKLEKRNVDTGSGFERIVAVVQGKRSVFDTDVFEKLILHIQKESNSSDMKAIRIIADHIRTAMFLVADGVIPSNTDRGYVLRRLIRRARYYYDSIGGTNKSLPFLIETIVPTYTGVGYGLSKRKENIALIIRDEENKFISNLMFGKKYIEKKIQENNNLSDDDVFLLYSTYGYPFELTKEVARENKIEINEQNFHERVKKHQELSRAGAEQKFKGGLAGTGEMETKYHTATHLLHQALRDILGDSVEQKGSNITAERLRFDFSFGRKMTDDEKTRVEQLINEKIQLKLPMNKVTLPKNEADKLGALHFFGDKYGDMVDVYYLGDTLESAYSKEFCGGPHVGNTSELGVFKIIKEEAVSAGVRRIKAVLELPNLSNLIV